MHKCYKPTNMHIQTQICIHLCTCLCRQTHMDSLSIAYGFLIRQNVNIILVWCRMYSVVITSLIHCHILHAVIMNLEYASCSSEAQVYKVRCFFSCPFYYFYGLFLSCQLQYELITGLAQTKSTLRLFKMKYCWLYQNVISSHIWKYDSQKNIKQSIMLCSFIYLTGTYEWHPTFTSGCKVI